MTTNPHIETIISFIASQMDGEQVPPSNSTAMEQLRAAVEALQTGAKDENWQVLGLRALGAVLARASSAIEAEKTLHAFIRRDGHV